MIVASRFSDRERDECAWQQPFANIGFFQLLHTAVIVDTVRVAATPLLASATGGARIAHGWAVRAVMGITLHIAGHAMVLWILIVIGNGECDGAGLHGQAQPDHTPARQHTRCPAALFVSNVSY